VVDLVAGVVARLDAPPSGERRSALPVTMMLFGMINWTHTWYRPDGPIAPEQLADLAADVFLHGVGAAKVHVSA